MGYAVCRLYNQLAFFLFQTNLPPQKKTFVMLEPFERFYGCSRTMYVSKPIWSVTSLHGLEYTADDTMIVWQFTSIFHAREVQDKTNNNWERKLS